MQVMSGRSNVFLIKCKNRVYLIDTSTRGNWKKLDNTLKALYIDRIDYLILTHTHHDHAANAKRVKEKYQTSVIVHQEEAWNLFNGQAKLPQGINFFTRTLINLLGKKLEPKFNFEPCPYDILVSAPIYDMRKVGLNAYILHTPGHSIGSMSLIIDEEIAIVGDAMFGVF